MITLTKRQKDLLEYLASRKEFVTIEQLSNLFVVSNRTIRNDLDQIKAFLQENGILLVKKPSFGIKIEANEKQRKALLEKAVDIFDRCLDKKERVSVIIMALLTNETISYQQLADLVYTSKQTVVNSFNVVEDLLSLDNIKISKVTGRGISLIGSEIDFRNSFEKIVLANENDGVVLDLIINQNSFNKYYLDALDFRKEVAHLSQLSLSDNRKTNILLSYFLYRLNTNKTLIDDGSLENYRNTETVNKLSQLNFDETNLLYLVKLLSNINDSSQRYLSNDDESEIQAKLIASYLIEKLIRLELVESININSLSQGLTMHLSGAIYRIRNHITIKNELLEQIKISIPLVYEFSKVELKKIENQYDLEFDENEIAYVAMYIASACEKSNILPDNTKVLLLCTFGLASSTILKSRLTQNMPECSIIGPLNEQQAIEYLETNDVSLVISTIEFETPKAKVVVVNPLLSIEDTTLIKSALFQSTYSNMCHKFIKAFALSPSESHSVCIGDYVSENHIRIEDSVANWQKAIWIAADDLLKENKITNRYVQRMIYAVEEYGTYMVLVDGVAFVHAGNDDGINENCTSILVLKQPIVFGSKNTTMVNCIVVMGIKDKGDSSLLNLVYIMENKDNRDKLKKENITIKEILNLKNKEDEVMDEILPLDCIAVNVEVSNWQNAIREAGKLLVNKQCIQNLYIENMIDSVKEFGPYIVLMPGFALAHSAPCAEVLKTSMSMITLKNPVNFGSANDPVKVVMVLACIDKTSHIEMLQKVATKLMDDGVVEQISNMNNVDDLYHFINN